MEPSVWAPPTTQSDSNLGSSWKSQHYRLPRPLHRLMSRLGVYNNIPIEVRGSRWNRFWYVVVAISYDMLKDRLSRPEYTPICVPTLSVYPSITADVGLLGPRICVVVVGCLTSFKIGSGLKSRGSFPPIMVSAKSKSPSVCPVY